MTRKPRSRIQPRRPVCGDKKQVCEYENCSRYRPYKVFLDNFLECPTKRLEL